MTREVAVSMAAMPWLPASDDAARASLAKALEDQTAPDFGKLRHAMNYRWQEADLRRVGKTMAQLAATASLAKSEFQAKTILVLSSQTFSHMADTLTGIGLRHGLVFLPTVVEYEDALLWLDRHPVEVVFDFAVVLQDAKSLGLNPAIGMPQSETSAARKAMVRTGEVLKKLASTHASQVIVQTVVEDIAIPFANMDHSLHHAHRQQVATYNAELAQFAVNNGFILLDTSALASFIGLSNWWPGRYRHMAKLPFAMANVPIFLDSLARIAATVSGKSRRVLVLDLDNTLWGGVIGDDGMEGISLSQGNAMGEAHLAIQNFAQQLKQRGIVLCVSSKNTHDIAIDVFRKHPDMILREEDIALFKINWIDKAANIKAMAESLNLGLEAFVFLDDNPVERQQVRDALPMVMVPELPKDPSDWPLYLAGAGCFEQTALTQEDLKRSDYYVAEGRRQEAEVKAGDTEGFLQSLDMELVAQGFDNLGRKRIAQLISKSNQFNLTTRRYSETEVAALETDASAITMQIRLSDKFGDNGMISAVVATTSGKSATIDLWIMSCRVIGRNVEAAVLSLLVQQLKDKGVETLTGIYVPTPRNDLVKDHYRKLGFAPAAMTDDGKTLWELDIMAYEPVKLPFTKLVYTP